MAAIAPPPGHISTFNVPLQTISLDRRCLYDKRISEAWFYNVTYSAPYLRGALTLPLIIPRLEAYMVVPPLPTGRDVLGTRRLAPPATFSPHSLLTDDVCTANITTTCQVSRTRAPALFGNAAARPRERAAQTTMAATCRYFLRELAQRYHRVARSAMSPA